MPLWLASAASQLQRTITSDTVPYYCKSERKITVQTPAWSPAYLSMWTRAISLNTLDIRLGLQIPEISVWIGICVYRLCWLAYKHRALIFLNDPWSQRHWPLSMYGNNWNGCTPKLYMDWTWRIRAPTGYLSTVLFSFPETRHCSRSALNLRVRFGCELPSVHAIGNKIWQIHWENSMYLCLVVS